MTRGMPSTFAVIAGAILALTVLRAEGPGPRAFENTPEPDHLSLFKLYMANHGRSLETPDFALRHYAIFEVPPGQSPECRELASFRQNEFTRRDLQEKALSALKEHLADAASWPRTATFRMRNREQLGQYSFGEAAFPLERNARFSLLQTNQPLLIARTPSPLRTSGRSSYYQGPVTDYCSLVDGRPLQFGFVLEGGEQLQEVPMAPAAAEALLEARRAGMKTDRQKGVLGTGREVELEILLTTRALPKPDVGNRVLVPARVVAARVRSVDSGELLHTFDMR